VTVITTGEDMRRGRLLGAFETVGKPIETRDGLRDTLDRLMRCVERPQRELVLVHPDADERAALTQVLASDGVRVRAVPALSALNGGPEDPLNRGLEDIGIDGVVLGVGAEADAVEVLGTGAGARLRSVPVLAYGPPDWSAGVESLLTSRGVEATVVPVSSLERLVDQCLLRLHRPVRLMSDSQREIVERLHHGPHALRGRRVLIVDDDIRNIFALTSVLERHEMRIVSAETGRGAIELLDRHGDVEIVLMDLMMPEMDGFETMRAIRGDARFRTLPIIAVTAKAMKGDREKCIEAGASDYLAKPVDVEELMSKLRDWLAR
jgi:CheY-like chemotaxis protein